MSRRSIRGKAYKKTTSRQYNVMIRDIGHHLSDNGVGKTKGEHYLFWCGLRDRLNAIGPPSRNITEWKKVWNDCQRSRKRREHFRMSMKQPKKEPIAENEEEEVDNEEEINYYNNDEFQNESSQQSFDAEMNLEESTSSYNIFTASATVQHQPPNNDILIPNQLPPLYRCPTIPNYTATTHEPQRQMQPNVNMVTSDNRGSHLNQELLFTMKTQMEHQSKLLEHMSQLSTNMTALMERQVVAIERQTVAVRRQATAMEHHTLVMNSFLDMIRDKMPKHNNNRTTEMSNGKL